MFLPLSTMLCWLQLQLADQFNETWSTNNSRSLSFFGQRFTIQTCQHRLAITKLLKLQNNICQATFSAKIKVVAYDSLHRKYNCQNPLFLNTFLSKMLHQFELKGLSTGLFWMQCWQIFSNNCIWICSNRKITRFSPLINIDVVACQLLHSFLLLFSRCNYTILWFTSQSVSFINQAKHFWLPPSWVD